MQRSRSVIVLSYHARAVLNKEPLGFHMCIARRKKDTLVLVSPSRLSAPLLVREGSL